MQAKRTQGMPLKKKTGPTFLDSKLVALGYDTYAKYLCGKHWRTTRERFYSDPHTPKECLCGATDELDLHHLTYRRLGAELLEDLRPLCRRCHTDVHVLARQGLMDLRLQGYTSDLRRARYLRERRDMLRRQGVPEHRIARENLDPDTWRENAQLRHDASKDRKEMARKLRDQLRAM